MFDEKQLLYREVSKKITLFEDVDRVYSYDGGPKPFCFNEEVSEVFDDMVTRSVPLYEESMRLSLAWALRFYQPETKLYDIGCSTGTFLDLFGRHSKVPVNLVGVDASQAMIMKAKEKLEASRTEAQIEFLHQRAQKLEFRPSSVVVVNYTLQFLPVADREKLMGRIYHSLIDGGIVILSDKLRAKNPVFQEIWTGLYESFKHQRGYSSREIARKKEALENVLVPLCADEQLAILRKAGFSNIDTILKWQQFTTLVAIKG